MSRGKKRGRSWEPTKDRDKVRRLPVVEFEDFAEADRVFRESLDDFAAPPPEAQRERRDEERSRTGKRAGKRTDYSVDLHGLKLSDAKERLDAVLQVVLADLRTTVIVTIITGKGLHSGPGGAVLPREIHRYVRQTYGAFILRLDDSPAEVSLGGVPLRGHFTVTFGRK